MPASHASFDCARVEGATVCVTSGTAKISPVAGKEGRIRSCRRQLSDSIGRNYPSPNKFTLLPRRRNKEEQPQNTYRTQVTTCMYLLPVLQAFPNYRRAFRQRPESMEFEEGFVASPPNQLVALAFAKLQSYSNNRTLHFPQESVEHRKSRGHPQAFQCSPINRSASFQPFS